MKLTLFLDRSLEENASLYFEKAKKLKKKLQGAEEALDMSKKKLKKLEKDLAKQEATKEQPKKKRKKEWYEKYRWFRSSEGFLVIGGRDATTNEILIKKHTVPEDIVFHTDMAGSPFFIVKTEGKKPGKATLQETADATASFSRGWTKGLSTMATFYVTPEQVTKTPKPGEALPKGAFMIYGKTTYLTPKMEVAIANCDDVIISGPKEAIESQTKNYLLVYQGDEKKSDIAKKIRSKIGGDLDDIMHMMPPGNCCLGK